MAMYKGQTQLNRIKPVNGETGKPNALRDLGRELKFIGHQKSKKVFSMEIGH